ncbi:MAG TPA: D-glycero-beta-D-manno-heptose 1-phosphate adenylyltransferase [Candidatus Cloacimonetes bacterium]|nr:D-glycero-beta-D-manno-heptose 1-phosphate adenylyltransferase [Candidatus Cloacimonadota bacterium]HEX37606.1 D-glycero-beta-D-manno-heptose 1-phosphate adenylyltransferase [Candidatus Cloacimonadota bacterium]
MIVTREELAEITQELHKAERKIVFTNGCFDLIHRGHVEYLNEAKKLGDILIIGLNSDNSVRRLKGVDRPINYEQDRAVVLDNLIAVDYVCIFDEDTPYELIRISQPDVLVKGGDWAVDDIVGSDIVLDRGGEVRSLHFIEGKSTTDIIEKIKNL